MSMKSYVNDRLQTVFLGEHLIVPEQPLLINPPRQLLLKSLFRLWLVLFFVLLFSYHVLFFATVPVHAALIVFYLRLARVWKAYRFSVRLLHTASCIVLVIHLVLTILIRTAFLEYISH